MKFYVDASLSVWYCQLLSAYDQGRNEYEFLPHKFGSNCPDVTWLTGISGENPIPYVLCGDGRILKNREENAALKGARVHFILIQKWQKLPWRKCAVKVIACWDDLCRQCESKSVPTVFMVRENGKVETYSL